MAADVSGGRSARLQPTITFVEDSPLRRPRVDLNLASSAELSELRGIGDTAAHRIVAARRSRPFIHVEDLATRGILTPGAVEAIRSAAGAQRNDRLNIYDLRTTPDHILRGKPFRLEVAFDDSDAGVRVVRLQLDSVSHSIDVTREISEAERGNLRLTFEMPAMETGVVNVQVTVYDKAADKDYLARTFHIFHNPAFVIFYPSERSLRLSEGAALKKTDGNFHCDSNFLFYNGTGATVTLNRSMTWQIFRQSGALLESGTWDFGSNITLAPWAISTGWWFIFSFPPGNVTYNRLQAKEWIRIEWRFTEVGTGTMVSDSLTWRAPLGPHVNIIRVGEENFTDAERTRVFSALRNTAGSIYQQQDMDIGRIATAVVSVADAGGYVTVNSNDEAEDLTEEWTVDNDGIDMFVVRSYVGSVAGLSPVGGPCDKSAKGMNGAVVEVQSTQSVLGVVMAHELGHYLGLDHTSATNNLMQPSVGSSNTVLISSQGNTMKGHCFIRFLA
jgi:hypothetical protein